MSRKIYVISGLGADHTVFQKLNLSGYELIHIKWVAVTKGESLSDYARRLLPQIKEENPIVLGLSLGGMLAAEVGQLIPTKKIISLSSIIGYSELPFHFKIAGWMRLQKIIPIHLFSKGNRFTHWIFGVKTNQDKKILNAVFDRLERDFLYWALNAILSWKKKASSQNIYRIHGTKDQILPKRKKANYNVLIKDGTHLMVLDKSEQVSQAILKALK